MPPGSGGGALRSNPGQVACKSGKSGPRIASRFPADRGCRKWAHPGGICLCESVQNVPEHGVISCYVSGRFVLPERRLKCREFGVLQGMENLQQDDCRMQHNCRYIFNTAGLCEKA
jgi:hypothetical protein